ncbi:polyprenyl synthetase family protein [Amorphoplanes nipponensis]|uniref:Geranylgeranyl pyrophosphate synthase n=1 Tax=Actinoplanes nipponensis TaxID=135950 RepID=A0A919JGU3_9ACTN|nr:polyprenyl synthetase family protein [Actinoplanes nipponensis]GIE48792.1 geranylgeranyl pyrophosphate synthase [Actinoplanes nipponensis]
MSDDGLAAAEAMLTGALDGAPEPLREPCRRLAEADGERLRARLVLAVAGQAWPGASRRTATAAAAVELLHLAMRVRDDLLADAPARNGTPTINAKEGPAVALLAGDLLIGLANRLAAAAGAGAVLGDALTEVCAGHTLAADNRLPADLSAATALRIAQLRTGTLLAAAGRLGAIVTGAPEDGLRDYGLAAGAALHVLDDVRDLLDDDAPGDPGIVTLPAVHAIAAHPQLRRLLRPGVTGAERERGRDLLRTGVPAALTTVDELTDRAAAARPDLADLTKKYRDSRLARLLPRYRALLSS